MSIISLAGGPGALVPLLSAGHALDPARPDEAMIDYGLQQRIPGLGVGSSIRVSFYRPGDAVASTQSAPGTGPAVTFHVVEVDIAGGLSLPGVGASGFLQLTPGFVRSQPTRIVRERGPGPAPARAQQAGLGAPSSSSPACSRASATSWWWRPTTPTPWPSTRCIPGDHLWIPAGLAALGAITVVAQGLTHQAAAETEFAPTLSALGRARETFSPPASAGPW